MRRIICSKRTRLPEGVCVFLIMVALIAGMAGCGGTPSGTEIRDWYDLDAIRDNLGGSYILTNDLDSTTAGYAELASPTANGGMGWQPIGTSYTKFTGILNGQGFEIRDLFINRPDEDNVGLFGYVRTGVIKDVGIANATVIGKGFVGGLVGRNGDYVGPGGGTISESYSTGSVTGMGLVGGLVGYNGGTVSSSSSTAGAAATGNVGGLVGHNRGTVNDSHSTGSVAAVARNGITVSPCRAGGLVGENDLMGNINNSYSTSSVTGCTADVGGLVGQNTAYISNSYSTGNVSGDSDVGGLAGTNVGYVSNSYSSSNVTGNSSVGGLVGWHQGQVSNSYSTGGVTGTSYVGGLVGENDGTVSNSFWDTETSGQNSSAGGTGKTTAEMKDIDTFSGATWDIIGVANPSIRNLAYIWNIVDNATYPFLS